MISKSKQSLSIVPGIPGAPGVGVSLLATSLERRAELEFSDDLAFLPRAVSRVVCGGVYLLGGYPSAGKSLLTTQIGLDLGRRGMRSLFILTEEPPASLKERALRVTGEWPPEQVQQAMANIQIEDGLCDLMSLPALIARKVLSPAGLYHGVKLVILDSIQGNGLPAGATHAYAKVLEGARLLADAGITVILNCHITKRGDLAGPKTLEHGVDATLIMKRALQYSLLFVRKNRFGPPNLRPMPLRVDPITTRLTLAPHVQAMPGAARTYAGMGSIGLLQVQAAVAVPADGKPGRVTATNLPRRKIEQLVACIGQIDDLDMQDLDYHIQCRLPGACGYMPQFGLALCMALVSSYLRKPIPGHHLYLGEIDLFRHVGAVPTDLLQMLGAAITNGEMPPAKLFASPLAAAGLADCADVAVVPCKTLEDAVFNTWPELR